MLIELEFAVAATLIVSAPATPAGPRMVKSSAVVGICAGFQLPAVPHCAVVAPFQARFVASAERGELAATTATTRPITTNLIPVASERNAAPRTDVIRD